MQFKNELLRQKKSQFLPWLVCLNNSFFCACLSLLIMSFTINKVNAEKIHPEELTIYTEHLSPFQIVKPNGDITGLATEIVRTALNRTSISYKIEAYFWSVSYQQTLKNKSACIYSLARNEARENKFIWLDLGINTTNSFYSLADKNISLDNIEQAKQYTTAVRKDDITHNYFIEKGFIEGSNLYVYEDFSTLLKFFDARKKSIDFIVLSGTLLKNRLENAHDLKKYKSVLLIEDLNLKLHLGCNVNISPILLNKITTSMQTMQTDGTIEKIKEKWQPYFY